MDDTTKTKKEKDNPEYLYISDFWRIKADTDKNLCIECFNQNKNTWKTKFKIHCNFTD